MTQNQVKNSPKETPIETIVKGFVHNQKQQSIFDVFKAQIVDYDVITDGINLALYAQSIDQMQDVSSRLDKETDTKEQKRLADLMAVHQARQIRAASALRLDKGEKSKGAKALEKLLTDDEGEKGEASE